MASIVKRKKKYSVVYTNVLGLVDIFVDRGPFHLPLLCRA